MVKFRYMRKKYVAIGVDGKHLYGYYINEKDREIKKFELYDKNITTFELPDLGNTENDERVIKDFLPNFNGSYIKRADKELVARYLTGSVTICKDCFMGIKKATLIVPTTYSICIEEGEPLEGWKRDRDGAFEDGSEIKLVIMPGMKAYDSRWTWDGEDYQDDWTPKHNYTLIASEKIKDLDEFYDADTNFYFYGDTDRYEVSHLETDIENS